MTLLSTPTNTNSDGGRDGAGGYPDDIEDLTDKEGDDRGRLDDDRRVGFGDDEYDTFTMNE